MAQANFLELADLPGNEVHNLLRRELNGLHRCLLRWDERRVRRTTDPFGGTYNASTYRKQENIKPPESGTKRHSSRVSRPTKTMQRRKAILTAAEAVIRRRYGEFDLTLTDIAEDVGTSPRQLQRVLRELGDTNFRSVLLAVRMEHAHRLLSREKTGLTVRQAARTIGYREASGLRWQFKRFYGYNPSEVQPEGRDFDDYWRAEEES